MARKIKAKVKLKEITFDEDLYPRSGHNWQVSYDYSQSMLVGAKFPPIVLAMFNGKKMLVDGKHRIEALKLLKKDEADAIVHTGWNQKKIFQEAVKANITHGRGLSPYEKRKIALKLREFEFKENEISKLIQVPQDKLENFVGKRLVNTITGEVMDVERTEEIAREIGQTILKSGVKHFAGSTLTEEELQNIEYSQRPFSMKSQVVLFQNVLNIFENGLLDKSNTKVMALVRKLKEHFKKI